MNALTRREREVFILMLLGCDSKDIGRRLSISWRTVDAHKSEVLRKCGARSTTSLAFRMLSTRKAAA